MSKQINVTIVGAGTYGSRIALRYEKSPYSNIKAVVSRSKPTEKPLSAVFFAPDAAAWKTKFGSPKADDVFEVCVHHNILFKILQDFVGIGAKNFILPKPLALSTADLVKIDALVAKKKLNVVVASQWHYSALVEEATDFIRKNKAKIASVEIEFSRTFDDARKGSYTATTAFLSHIVQILAITGLVGDNSSPLIGHASNHHLSFTYEGKYKISARTDLATSARKECMEVFLKGSKKPALVIDFSQSMSKEDLLDKMTDINIKHFLGDEKKSTVLTFAKYLSVAKHVARVAEKAKNSVCVIGGGLFGLLTALEVAKKGYSVTVFEKAADIITGASLVNHTRIHMGYHYPRHKGTVVDSLEAKAPFEKFFGKDVVRKIKNYYMVAKEGSLTSPDDFLSFCKKMNLPHKIQWPADITFSKDKIALSVKVPETIFDATRKREVLRKKITTSPDITLLTSTMVTSLRQEQEGFHVEYKIGDSTHTSHFGAVINATYGATNHVNKFLGLPLDTFQYELCEIPVVKTPWKDTGWMIMDGPFFSAMPFGFSKNHLFYDVELSVLERSIGEFPTFKFSSKDYDTVANRKERFAKYVEKWKPWLPEIVKCKQVSSMYATRIVLHQAEKTDARPTRVKELVPGFWRIFSGKIATSVPQAIELAQLVDAYFKKPNL